MRINDAVKGFTLIELVLVLVLVGILSIVGIGLFGTKTGYTARTTADQLLAQARLAQQVALGRGVSGSTSFAVSRSGDNITLSVTQGAYSAIRNADGQGVTVRWKDSATTSCGGGSSTDFSLQFNGRGDATSPGGNAANTLICVSGNRTIPICISTLGVAYEGVCDS